MTAPPPCGGAYSDREFLGVPLTAMQIEDLDTNDAELHEALAALTHTAAAGHAPDWLRTNVTALAEHFDEEFHAH